MRARDIRELIKFGRDMVSEARRGQMGSRRGGKCSLEKFDEAFDMCSKMFGLGLQVIITP
jgi:hypothetical protein